MLPASVLTSPSVLVMLVLFVVLGAGMVVAVSLEPRRARLNRRGIRDMLRRRRPARRRPPS